MSNPLHVVANLVKKNAPQQFYHSLSLRMLCVFLALAALSTLYFVQSLAVLWELSWQAILNDGWSWISFFISAVLIIVLATIAFFTLIAKHSASVMLARCVASLRAKKADRLKVMKVSSSQ